MAVGLNLLLLRAIRPEPTQGSATMRLVATHPAPVVALGSVMVLVGVTLL
ncbi:hypothetical protein HC251_17280 [Iamia sp. SCSIO 61187]|nr:hypothetical protein [Iamia sp. SCSIO 61187]QYG94016.1 hypothetical protein HC251_17280 [Iamia sp. SCSIO 61187]